MDFLTSSSPTAENSMESKLLLIIEFPAVGKLDARNATEFSAAGNSKIGELEAGNSKRRTRKLPASTQEKFKMFFNRNRITLFF